MAKKTEQDTSPVRAGEVNKEGTTSPPQDTVDTKKQAEESAKQAELEAQKLAEENAKKAELEALKQAELEAQKLAEENAKKAELEALKQAELEVNRLAEEYANKELEVNDRLINGYEYRGRKYNFTANMPLKVNLDGQIMSKVEIMSNTDVLESMIDSKNIFIKEIEWQILN